MPKPRYSTDGKQLNSQAFQSTSIRRQRHNLGPPPHPPPPVSRVSRQPPYYKVLGSLAGGSLSGLVLRLLCFYVLCLELEPKRAPPGLERHRGSCSTLSSRTACNPESRFLQCRPLSLKQQAKIGRSHEANFWSSSPGQNRGGGSFLNSSEALATETQQLHSSVARKEAPFTYESWR